MRDEDKMFEKVTCFILIVIVAFIYKGCVGG